MSSVNKFGRLVAPKDARDLRYRMVAMLPQLKALKRTKPRTQPYRIGPILDQGNTPQCVGYSSRSFLESAPIMTKGNSGPSSTTIYKEAQRRDEWPNENYDGTSVRGAMKYLTDSGEASSYVWGQTVEEAISWLKDDQGTLLVGTNWYAEMSSVDSQKFMREPASSMSTPIGGHAWHVIWYDAKLDAFLMKNSWGHDFGYLKKGALSGLAYVRRSLMQRLLAEDGEIAAPTQLKLTPVPLF